MLANFGLGVKMSVLWKEILAVSTLAASMRDIYEAVCRNRIAVLELSLGKGSVGHSVQIPMPFYVSDIQPQASEATRSLWLTTANNVSRYDTLGGVSAFDKCFALLLTDDDEKKIIAELQARGDKAAAAMIELVKASKPTLSYVLSIIPTLVFSSSNIGPQVLPSLSTPRYHAQYPTSARLCTALYLLAEGNGSSAYTR